MKIIFIIPPAELNIKKLSVDRLYGCNYGFDYKPSLHLLLLATIAKQLGHEASFLDCPAENFSIRKLIKYVKNISSSSIFVYFSVWLSLKEDLLSAELISRVTKDAKFIFTGSYPTWKPNLFIKNENYFVVRGEPEITLEELLAVLKSKSTDCSEIRGLSFMRKDEIVDNPMRDLANIDYFPIPDRTMLKRNYSFNRIFGYPATAMCVSRGCCYRCTYCAPNALDQAIEIEYYRVRQCKPPVRVKDKKLVIDEFMAIDALGYRGVELCDNNFVQDSKRMETICDAIRPLGLEWICYVRSDRLKDKTMVKLMKESGCRLIYIGTESFCQNILDDVKKDLKVEDNYKAVELLKECGINPEISILLGASDKETQQTIDFSVGEARKLKTNFVHYAIASPLPNTELYRNAKNDKRIVNGDFNPMDNISAEQLKLTYLSDRQLKNILRECYRGQYLKISFFIQQLKQLQTFMGCWHRIKSLIKFLRYLNQKH